MYISEGTRTKVAVESVTQVNEASSELAKINDKLTPPRRELTMCAGHNVT